MSYARAYLKRGLGLAIMVTIGAAVAQASVLFLIDSGILDALLLAMTDAVGVSAQVLVIESGGTMSEEIATTGALQIIGLELAVVAYLALRFGVDWIRTMGGVAADPGASFSNTFFEALVELCKELLTLGIPLAFLIFCASTLTGLLLHSSGSMPPEAVRAVMAQTLLLTPLLLFMQIGAETLLR